MNEQKVKLKYISDISALREIIDITHQYTRDILVASNKKQSHSFDHILRVVNTCYNLAIQLEAYLDVTLLAAFFHDVGRPIEEETGKCHAEVGAEIAEEFLKKNNLIELVQDVCDAIKSHRFSKGIEPKTTEAKILQDADALDALGEIGLYRTISFSCEGGLNLKEAIKHFDDKLLKLPARMHFPITRELAKKRCEILIEFKEGIQEELKCSEIGAFLKKLA